MRLKDINFSILSTFILVHLITFGMMLEVKFQVTYLWWFAALYCLRWLGFTCAVHRYFSHKVCQTSRTFQFLLAVWGTLTMARAPIRFASGHRHHHTFSDTPRDLHSVRSQGVLFAYLGWVIHKDYHEDVLGRVGRSAEVSGVGVD